MSESQPQQQKPAIIPGKVDINGLELDIKVPVTPQDVLRAYAENLLSPISHTPWSLGGILTRIFDHRERKNIRLLAGGFINAANELDASNLLNTEHARNGFHIMIDRYLRILRANRLEARDHPDEPTYSQNYVLQARGWQLLAKRALRDLRSGVENTSPQGNK